MPSFCPDSADDQSLRDRAVTVLGYFAPLAGFLLAVLAAAWLSGCDALSEDDPVQRVIVEAFLEADEPLPPVRLSRTAGVRETYSFGANAISGATVTLSQVLDGLGSTRIIEYAESDTTAGVYYPVGTSADTSAARVVSGGRYRLDVATAAGEALSAETTVPTAFETLLIGPDTLTYNLLGEPPAVRVTASTFPGRPAIYQLAVEATGQLPNPDPADLVPFRCDFYEDDPDDFDLVDTARGTSPVLNEGSFEFEADGTLTISVPWLAIAYYGETTLKASALDDALYDFLTTQSLQFNPGTLSPGEIPNVESNVEGGVGVFGAYAQTERRVVILPPPGLERCEPADDGG